MSLSNRIRLRESYMEGWYQMDAALLLSSTAVDFVFDDPFETAAVTRDQLEQYMHRWDARTRSQGANNQWILSHHKRDDEAGILTDWLWWQLVDTDLQGSALVLTSDEGVILERITYFDRPPNRS